MFALLRLIAIAELEARLTPEFLWKSILHSLFGLFSDQRHPFVLLFLPGKDNGVTSSSDGRALHGPSADVPSPAGFAGVPLNAKHQQHPAGAGLHLPMEKDTSHDSMVSSTSNLPSSSESQGSEAASVLLYQSSNCGKDPRLWNVQEVTTFMYSIGCSNYADAFVKEVCALSCISLCVFVLRHLSDLPYFELSLYLALNVLCTRAKR